MNTPVPRYAFAPPPSGEPEFAFREPKTVPVPAEPISEKLRDRAAVITRLRAIVENVEHLSAEQQFRLIEFVNGIRLPWEET